MTSRASPGCAEVAYPSCHSLVLFSTLIVPTAGAPVAVAVAWVHGLPTHAVVNMFLLAYATGFGVTLGFHRLFTHRSYGTSRWMERDSSS